MHSMSQQDCIFCRIARNEIPAEIVYADDTVVAFNDIEPQAPVHVVLIPRTHIASLADTTGADAPILGHLLDVARSVAAEKGLAECGYRIVNNCGSDALQTVKHIHFHLLGGRKFGWPPG